MATDDAGAGVTREQADRRLVRGFAQSEFLNRLQPPDVRLERAARNYLHMKRMREQAHGAT